MHQLLGLWRRPQELGGHLRSDPITNVVPMYANALKTPSLAEGLAAAST